MAALKPLTVKQTKFLEAYFANGQNVRAAMRDALGVESSGGDHDMVNHPSVKAAIDAHKAAAAERIGLNAEFLLGQVKAIAGFDVANLYDADGKLRPVHEIDAETRKAIAAIEHGQFGTKVKAHDKLGGITLAMKHLGMLVDKVEHSGTVGVTGMAERIRARRDAQSTKGYA